MLMKEYLGEAALPLDNWFKDDNAYYRFDDRNNKVRFVHSVLWHELLLMTLGLSSRIASIPYLLRQVYAASQA
jgi:hypothetical protein